MLDYVIRTALPRIWEVHHGADLPAGPADAKFDMCALIELMLLGTPLAIDQLSSVTGHLQVLRTPLFAVSHSIRLLITIMVKGMIFTMACCICIFVPLKSRIIKWSVVNSG
jgi:hypothetical protein